MDLSSLVVVAAAGCDCPGPDWKKTFSMMRRGQQQEEEEREEATQKDLVAVAADDGDDICAGWRMRKRKEEAGNAHQSHKSWSGGDLNRIMCVSLSVKPNQPLLVGYLF